jgi:hypothetical protein
MVQISDAFEVEGFVEQRKELDRLLMSNPAMEKKVQGLIRKVLAAVKKSLGQAARDNKVMKSDPRNAYKAIRTAVYKRILGGNVNILNKRRASSAGGSYNPTRTLRSGKRGGNRKARNERTYRLESYEGSDRGFILRFLNAGTDERHVKFLPDSRREHVHRGSQGGNIKKYGKTINTGRRGRIKARNWFGSRSQREMEAAANNLEKFIDALIQQELK